MPPPSPDQNGRKIRSVSCGAIPGPVSVTDDRHLAVGPAEPEVDASALRRPVERVREEVRDDLQHAVAVGDEHRSLPEREVVLDAARPRLLGEGRVGALAEGAHVDLLAQDREAASVELGQVENVSHETLQPQRLLGDHLERPPP